MEEYRRTFRVQAHASAVLEALTTPAGITAWWTETTGAGKAGGVLSMTFGTPDPMTVRVDRAGPASVQWTVLDCPVMADWDGTRPEFVLEQIGGTTEVTFRHHGLSEELECHDVCSRSWDHFMLSLKQYVETGTGMPRGSEADLAWRRAG